MDLYYMLESPPCRSVLMVAKLLDIDFNQKSLDLSKGEQMNPQFIELNPFHCLPTLVDNDLVLWESRAIITYLVNAYKPSHPLYPSEPKTRATIDRLLNYDLGTIYSNISAFVSPLFFGGELDDKKEDKLKETFDLFDSMVAKTRFVCGQELSLADISIESGFQLLEATDYSLNQWTHICKWIENVKQELNQYYDELNAKAIQNTRQYIQYLRSKNKS